MKIALAQINTTVGDLTGNVAKIRAQTLAARELGAELVIFPELCLTGYPPRDLLDSLEFKDAAAAALAELAHPADWNAGVALIVGFPEHHEGTGRGAWNTAAFIAEGAIQALGRKSLLPYYDVFDEPRYFEAADQSALVPFKGLNLGLTVCEDAWNSRPLTPAHHHHDPIAALAGRGADLIVNLSASPFEAGKAPQREEMFTEIAERHGVQVAFVNAVGGNDSLIFDGGSVAVAADGRVAVRCARFVEDLQLFDTSRAGVAGPAPTPPREAEIWAALRLGLRDYFEKTGFSKALLGLSGGIDSALVAALAADALGPEQVLGVLMPSRYSSDHSVSDALALAEALGVETLTLPIEGPHQAFLEALAPPFAGRPPGLAEENLQARVRGVYLMALSNKLGHLLLTTGNKSELAVGYATLYGDMCGGLAPIADLLKTEVYALARWRNLDAGRDLIPAGTLSKAPSAELRPDQRDQDSLPPYEDLDAIISCYVEDRLGPAGIIAATGLDEGLVQQVLGMITRAEHKRRQAAPGLKVSRRMFGESWRMPIARA